MREKTKQRRGQVLIGAVFVILIVALLGMIVVNMVNTETSSALQNWRGLQALNIAEGGIRFTMVTSLDADSDWSDNSDFGPVALDPGTFSVHYVSQRKRSCLIEVTGVVGGVSRTVQARFRERSQLPAQFTEYASYGVNPMSKGKDIFFLGDSKIVGNFFYFGPIKISGSRPPRCQTGGVIKSISIDTGPGDWTDYYTSWEAIESAEAVYFDNTYYDNWLSVAVSTTKNDLSLTSGTFNLAGGTYKYQNIDLGGDVTIIGPGTLCATTTFRTEPGNTVHFSGAVRLISRGKPTSFDFNGNTSWSEAAEIIGIDDLKMSNFVSTPADSILYSKSAVGNVRGITLGGYAHPGGSLLAPYGLINNGGRAWIRGLVYAYKYYGYNYSTLEGGSVFDTMAAFQDDTMVIQNNDCLPDEPPPGISAEASLGMGIYNWQEVY
jgi:hypothetical protein